MENQRVLKIAVMSMILLFTSTQVLATSSEGHKRAKSGTVICSGNFSTAGGQHSRWIIHNVSDNKAITLERMKVLSADATVLYDSDLNGPAPSSTVVAFGVMQANQTIAFKSEDLIAAGLLPGNLPGNQRPVKVIFEWESTVGGRVITRKSVV